MDWRRVLGEAMAGLKPVAGLRVILAGACTIAWISAARPAGQQYNNVCQIFGGRGPTCTVDPALIGSPCGCFTPSGRVPGKVIESRGEGDGQLQTSPQTSNVCETKYGRCRISPKNVGDNCDCRNDPGKVK
jgi:hypothetical protein